MFETDTSESTGTPAQFGRPKPSVVAWLLLLALAVTLIACGSPSPSPPSPFPDADVAADWVPTGEAQVYDSDNLFDLVNGQAEAIFAYGFEQVTVQDYQDSTGAVISIEVWQTASAADAYGLFASQVAGSPSDIGNDSDSDPGRRLAFWQDRYYVRVRARQEVADASLRSFAGAVAAELPSGGDRPSVVGRLPPEGLMERSPIFFHEEISLQSRLWLGGENLLGLGPETDGVLGGYDLGGARALLILVEYPDASGPSDGLAALQGGEVAELVTAATSDNLLAAVFGAMDEEAASALIAVALAAQ